MWGFVGLGRMGSLLWPLPIAAGVYLSCESCWRLTREMVCDRVSDGEKSEDEDPGDGYATDP